MTPPITDQRSPDPTDTPPRTRLPPPTRGPARARSQSRARDGRRVQPTWRSAGAPQVHRDFAAPGSHPPRLSGGWPTTPALAKYGGGNSQVGPSGDRLQGDRSLITDPFLPIP